MNTIIQHLDMRFCTYDLIFFLKNTPINGLVVYNMLFI